MVEVLISMLLLAIMLVGLAALQVGTIRNVMDSGHYAEGTRLAESVLERYQTMSYSALPPASSPPVWTIVTRRDGINPMQKVAVNGEDPGPFTVQQLIEDPPTGGRLITLRVSWLQASAASGATGGAAYRTSSVLMSIKRFQ